MNFRFLSMIALTIALLVSFGIAISNLQVAESFIQQSAETSTQNHNEVFLGDEDLGSITYSGAQVIDVIVNTEDYPYYVEVVTGGSSESYFSGRKLTQIEIPSYISMYTYEMEVTRNSSGEINTLTFRRDS